MLPGAAAMKGPGMPTPSLPKGNRTSEEAVDKACNCRAARPWGCMVAGAATRPTMPQASTQRTTYNKRLGKALRQQQSQERQAKGEVTNFYRRIVEYEAEREQARRGC